jgi:hypothetical protein
MAIDSTTATADELRAAAKEYRDLAARLNKMTPGLAANVQVMPGSELAAAAGVSFGQMRQCVGDLEADLLRQADELDKAAATFGAAAEEQRSSLASVEAPLASIPRPI